MLGKAIYDESFWRSIGMSKRADEQKEGVENVEKTASEVVVTGGEGEFIPQSTGVVTGESTPVDVEVVTTPSAEVTGSGESEVVQTTDTNVVAMQDPVAPETFTENTQEAKRAALVDFFRLMMAKEQFTIDYYRLVKLVATGPAGNGVRHDCEEHQDDEEGHYDTLANCVYLLGGVPYYEPSHYDELTAKYNLRSCGPQEYTEAVVKVVIELEDDSVKHYDVLIDMLDGDPGMQDKIIAIRNEEVQHAFEFRRWYADITYRP